MNPNIFDPEYPEKWYLVIEYTDNGKVVRAAGSLAHCSNYATQVNRAIISYLSASFFGV